MKNIILILSILAVFTINLQAQTFTNYTETDGLISNNATSIAFDASNDIWIGTQNGASHFDRTNWTNYNNTMHPGLVDDGITSIEVASDSTIWFGTDFGISTFDGTNWTTYTTADGLGNNRITYIKQGPAGNIWVGEKNGLSVFDGSSWTAYGTSNGLPFGGITYVTFDTNGDKWLGTGLSGIRIFDGTNFTPITTSDGLVNNKVRSIAIDNMGSRWIATATGISVFDSNNQHLYNHTRVFTLPAPDTLNPVEDIQVDSSGRIWAGVYVDYLLTEGGISLHNTGNWLDYDVSDGLVGPVVRRLAVDANNEVWVATSTGISRISNVSTAIDEDLDFNFKLYPNPATDLLHIMLAEVAPSAQKVEVFNLNMQLVLSSELQPVQNSISLSVGKLPSGLYFVKTGDRVSRFVVE